MNYGYQTYDVVGHSEIMRPAAQGIVLRSPSTGGSLDSLKEWLDKRSVANIPNKFIVAGVAAAGLLYYGHKKRWF